MHNELRYQAKTHAISEKLFKKNYASTPQFFFLIKTCFKGKETKLNLACVARSNMSSRRNDQNYQYRKVTARRAFSVIPRSTCIIFSRTREIGEKIIMVPRLQSK
jgi:hypothetical protein